MEIMPRFSASHFHRYFSQLFRPFWSQKLISSYHKANGLLVPILPNNSKLRSKVFASPVAGEHCEMEDCKYQGVVEKVINRRWNKGHYKEEQKGQKKLSTGGYTPLVRDKTSSTGIDLGNRLREILQGDLKESGKRLHQPQGDSLLSVVSSSFLHGALSYPWQCSTLSGTLPLSIQVHISCSHLDLTHTPASTPNLPRLHGKLCSHVELRRAGR